MLRQTNQEFLLKAKEQAGGVALSIPLQMSYNTVLKALYKPQKQVFKVTLAQKETIALMKVL